MYINVIGAGLAGCEAAMQIASRGIEVHLYEMKPAKKSPAHKSDMFGELVCSNSLKAMRLESAAGLLKEEMRRLNSFLMKCADKCQVPAGGALAVDRNLFSAYVTDGIKNNPNIKIYSDEVTEIPSDAITVIATGPLTSDALAETIKQRFGDSLSFFVNPHHNLKSNHTVFVNSSSLLQFKYYYSIFTFKNIFNTFS